MDTPQYFSDTLDRFRHYVICKRAKVNIAEGLQEVWQQANAHIRTFCAVDAEKQLHYVTYRYIWYIYLLDEPENSLSAQLQMELADYLAGMARFYGCQFIISSHSPFILSTPFAKIYDMDSSPVKVTKWTEVPSVKLYHDFFEQHADEF